MVLTLLKRVGGFYHHDPGCEHGIQAAGYKGDSFRSIRHDSVKIAGEKIRIWRIDSGAAARAD